MSKVLDMVFQKRGYDEEYLKEINQNKRTDLLDVDVLIEKLFYIRQDGKKLVVLPDFDMDGIMSGVLGFAGFAELGFNVELFIPSPSKGYSFNQEVIEDLVKEHPGVDAIITCDNGITAFDGVSYAKSLGLEVFITDHHKPFETYPDADVIVDPLRHDDTYFLKGICGAHVLWHVLMRFAKTFGTKEQIIQIERLQVFAGIGTVSDIMPMLYENRELVSNAISICKLTLGIDSERSFFVEGLTGSIPYKMAYMGLYEVLRLFLSVGKITEPDDIDEEFFGFYLAPMFNSVKRLDGSMEIAFRAFFGPNQEEYVKQLYDMNEKRKLLVNQYMDEINHQDNSYGPYVYVTTASSGIVGLLASKIMQETGLPTFVVHQNEEGYGFSGSGRSPEWFSAHSILSDEGFFIAGHEGAFGCGFTDESEIQSLVAFLDKTLPVILEEMEKEGVKEFPYDYILDTQGEFGLSIDIFDFSDFLQECKRLKPFGRLFEKPEGLLVIQKDEWDRFELVIMGSQKQHMKITLNQGFEVLLWNQASYFDELNNSDFITIRGTLGKSEFMGRQTINFMGDVVSMDKEMLKEALRC